MTTTNTIAVKIWWVITLSICSITAGRYGKKLRYLHTKVTLNQVYAAGWLNETALNRGYSGSGEKMSAIALDNQLDGSVDTGAINHRLLVGIDYQDRSNHTTGYYGAFPPIDAFNPVYGAQPDYITLYSREKT